MKFVVEITETLQKSVEVDAKSAEEAVSAVRRRYYSGETVLGPSDYVDVAMETVASAGDVCLCAR